MQKKKTAPPVACGFAAHPSDFCVFPGGSSKKREAACSLQSTENQNHSIPKKLLSSYHHTECPVSDEDDYRIEVLISLRRLERLDKDEYTDDERQEAEEVSS